MTGGGGTYDPASTIVFRADADRQTGGGHLMRCLALADAMAADGWSIAFACNPAAPKTVPALTVSGHDVLIIGDDATCATAAMAARWPDGVAWLAVDHYGFDAGFESACRPWADRIMAIDDLADRRHDCDVLLDQNLGRTPDDYAGLAPDDCLLLLGPAYALLRRQFAAARNKALSRRKDPPVERIFVSMGMTDPNHLTGVALDAIAKSGIQVAVDVALGNTAPHMEAARDVANGMPQRTIVHTAVEDIAELMAEADLAIGTAGSGAWERCALGLPSLLMVAQENQRLVFDQLIEAGAATPFQCNDGCSASDRGATLRTLAQDTGLRSAMATAAAAICDGLGAARTAAVLKPEIARDGRSVRLRPARLEDGEMMLGWQRHPDTRRFAKIARAPAPEEHFAWLTRKLADVTCVFNIVLHGEAPAGVLRYDRLTGPVETIARYRISVLVAPNKYRLGIADAALALGRRMLPRAEFLAEVLPGNEASHHLFQNAGFVIRDGDYVAKPDEAS